MTSVHSAMLSAVALGQVIVIDLTLAGDNAIVVAMAAAALPRDLRGRAILLGISVATLLRILFAVIANQIMAIIGLTLAGGVLLLWVGWRFWRELAQQRFNAAASLTRGNEDGGGIPPPLTTAPKSIRQAIVQIVIADVSMSLDNVLAVAGAAAQHTWIMIFGLLLSVGLMGAAATLIAGVLKRYDWIAYLGLAIILWVSVDMIYRGGTQVMMEMTGPYGITSGVHSDLLLGMEWRTKLVR